MSQITKKALEDALRHFLTLKPLNKITISDLTDYCGVSRMTFYYHFEDIYDLLIWCGRESIRKNLDLDDLQADWKEGLLRIFQVAQADRVIILNVYRVMGREQLERYLAPPLHRIVSHIVDEEAKVCPVSEEDKAFIIRCYNYIFIGLILDWIQGGMTEDPAHIIKRVDTLLGGSVSLALSQFASRPPAL